MLKTTPFKSFNDLVLQYTRKCCRLFDPIFNLMCCWHMSDQFLFVVNFDHVRHQIFSFSLRQFRDSIHTCGFQEFGIFSAYAFDSG